jgi:aryl-alcohol dehydrogenase-like predicted oxidoreductase
MSTRKLGHSGLEVSPLCLGGNVFGWTVDEAAAFPILDAFVDAGLNFIDTADVYSVWIPGHHGGESETVIGNWLKRSGKRDKVILATKIGMEISSDQKGLAKSYILEGVERSLKRLQTDYIDLYQSHVDDANTPMEETLQAYDQLIRQGKVRVIGASNFTAARLVEALELSGTRQLPRYESLQPLYNLYDRAEYETTLAAVAHEQGIGVIPYFSLASVFLTGKYRSESDLTGAARGGRVKKYLNERGFRILKALDHVAAQYNATPAKVSLAWMLSKPTITAPIASATNLNQLKDLVDATTLQLDQASLQSLDEASAY